MAQLHVKRHKQHGSQEEAGVSVVREGRAWGEDGRPKQPRIILHLDSPEPEVDSPEPSALESPVYLPCCRE